MHFTGESGIRVRTAVFDLFFSICEGVVFDIESVQLSDYFLTRVFL